MSTALKKEKRFKGTSVSEGIAIGSAYFLQSSEDEVPEFSISVSEVDAEIARYRSALFSSKKDLDQIKQDLKIEGSDDAINFIDSHIQMLEDPMITTHMEGKIRQNLRNTESVFRSVIKDYESRFTERSNAFFQQRLVDVMDISKRILGHLNDQEDEEVSGIPPSSIVFSEEITPSFTAAAQTTQIGAFVTAKGGGNSHAALIARTKGIPFVASIDVEQVQELNPEQIIIDGFQGIVIIDPSQETLEHYRALQVQLTTRYQLHVKEDHLKAETVDGFSVRLLVNVGNPEDLDTFPYQHDGIGLYRSEYLFLQGKEVFPSEDSQKKVYQELSEKMGQLPVTIRVFDLGGDKNPVFFPQRQQEPNPILGSRGIRFLLRNPGIFKTQLRAIFKVAKGSNLQILLPLISDINELVQSKALIEEVKNELKDTGFDPPDLPLGCMIEVPSAVMICDAIAENCDFLSIGTNDLVQYTLGIDRSNPAMSELYYPAHPSVLRMLKMVSIEAKRQNTPVTICGEIASNTLMIPLLLGLGLEVFSLPPRYIPYVKQTIRKWTIVEAYQLAEKVLKLSDPKEIATVLKEAQKK